MKLLVLAQTPPPLHGQSVMVQTLVDGLPAQGIEVHHVNLRLSRDAADIGGWRLGKMLTVFDACFHAIAARFTRGCDTLYYVPAPAKRGALYRDWGVMLLCRPFFKRLVLHWHATGLGEWLAQRATAPERFLSRWLLGRADLAVVLADSLRADAEALAARRIAVVPNGIPDPNPDFSPRLASARGCFEVLFLGLGSEPKGLFDAAAAVLEANRQAGQVAFRLTAAGEFPDAATGARFQALAVAHPGEVRQAGFVTGEAKRRLLRESDCLCLPTRYPHEGQPLVLLEAMAADLPVIATRWRGIPDMLPTETACLIAPGEPGRLVAALQARRLSPPTAGLARRHYLSHFTVERHLANLAAALDGLAIR
jgi:glycosyltransferase involved in cell wall biosynthesis